jgi:hypothetical protein
LRPAGGLKAFLEFFTKSVARRFIIAIGYLISEVLTTYPLK